MGSIKIHDYLKKRDILNDPELTEEEAKKWAEACFNAGFFHDALEFYKKAKDKSGLEKILEVAEREGDHFLVYSTLKALKKDYSTDKWLKLARKAEELNKYVFASQAYKMAGKEDEAARLMFLSDTVLDSDSKHA